MIKLAIRNINKKIKNYIAYIASLVLIYGFMYGFNHLVFSNNMKKISLLMSSVSSTEFFAIIMFFSLIIALIQGWFICYMNDHMFKKRSKEIAIYMSLGINKTKIKQLILLENILLTPIIIVFGTIIGLFIADSLEYFLSFLLGISKSGEFALSIKALSICSFYCMISVFISFLFLNKKINTYSINKLFIADRLSENIGTKNIKIKYSKIITSIVLICGSFFLLTIPNNNPMVIFFAIPMIILSIILLFNTIIPYLFILLNSWKKWKYKRDNLFILRLFTFRLDRIKKVIAIVTSLLVASITCLGISGAFFRAYQATVNEDIFDLFIINYRVDEEESLENKLLLERYFPNAKIVHYMIYSGNNKDFKIVRDHSLNEYLNKNGFPIDASELSYAEFQDDKYMSISDYNMLRQNIGLKPIELNNKEIAIHCLPYLEKSFRENDSLRKNYNIKHINIESFSQYKNYANGQDFIVIVSEEQIANLKEEYSIIGIELGDKINRINIDILLTELGLSKINYGMSFSLENGLTLLNQDGDSFLGGKIVKISQNNSFLMITSLSYISIVLAIMALEILFFEFINQMSIYRENYKKISFLGYDRVRMKKIIRKHTGLYFLVIGIPTCVFSYLSIYIFSKVCWIKTYEIPLTNINIESNIMSLIIILTFILIQTMLWAYTYRSLKKRLLWDVE